MTVRRRHAARHRAGIDQRAGIVRVAAAVAVAVVLASCSGGSDLPAAQPSTEQVVDSGVDSATDVSVAESRPVPQTTVPVPPRDVPAGALLVDPANVRQPIDRRLRGTNLPAWVRADNLEDPAFQEAALASGTTLIRMPGGSWSNSYDWLACENGDEDGCFWTWAARPSDYITFLADTGLEGMWTVSINETAQQAAAAVAFFNGAVGDDTAIGVDRDGVDWGTVGRWATLRVEHGHPEPAGIELWEVGNEVYGAQQATGGPQCAAFGWEEVWTCDGAEYVDGTADHDGAQAIRAAMLAADPTISVGMVGTGILDNWNNFGNEVIERSGSEMDFYVVHFYGFDFSPSGADAISRAPELWPSVVADVRTALPDDIPIAVTEHNLVSIEANDPEHTMTQTMNALYLADTIGQLAELGVPIANQWDLANGTTGSGTDYGLISLEDGSRFPAFDALAMWGQTGGELLQTFGESDAVRLYPTRHADGSLTIMVLGLGDVARDQAIVVDGVPDGAATFESVWSDALDATAWTGSGTDDVEIIDEAVVLAVQPWSIGLLRIPAP